MNEWIFESTKKGFVSILSNVALGQDAVSIKTKQILNSVLQSSKFKLRSHQVFNRKYGETILDVATRKLAR